MRVDRLSLYNFRNFGEWERDFGSRVIGMVGENGRGKTNVLEALYSLATGESWRTAKLGDVMKWEMLGTRVSGKLSGDLVVELSLNLVRENVTASNRSKYFVNNVARSKQTFSEVAPCVVFAPEDLQAVQGSPTERRAMLDRVLAVGDKMYAFHLRQYTQVVTRRNKVLQAIREGEMGQELLPFWTDKMKNHGSYVVWARCNFFSELEVGTGYATKYLPNLQVDLGFDLKMVELAYENRLDGNLFKEIASGVSQYGPHKDDLMFEVKDKDASRFASRGQQRSVMVWFLMQQYRHLRQKTGKIPYVLLDDIFSELDAAHRDEMMTFFNEAQVFVTGCEEKYFLEGQFDEVINF